jgi:hypothetical protein
MVEKSARRVRRVHRAGVPGADPTPQKNRRVADTGRASNDKNESWGDRNDSNDAQLKRDVPPHW